MADLNQHYFGIPDPTGGKWARHSGWVERRLPTRAIARKSTRAEIVDHPAGNLGRRNRLGRRSARKDQAGGKSGTDLYRICVQWPVISLAGGSGVARLANESVRRAASAA